MHKCTKFLNLYLEFNSIHSVHYFCSHLYVSTYGHSKFLGLTMNTILLQKYIMTCILSNTALLIRRILGITTIGSAQLHVSASNIRHRQVVHRTYRIAISHAIDNTTGTTQHAILLHITAVSHCPQADVRTK
jgi:hypothetical protein